MSAVSPRTPRASAVFAYGVLRVLWGLEERLRRMSERVAALEAAVGRPNGSGSGSEEGRDPSSGESGSDLSGSPS